MDAETFKRLMGPIEELLQRNTLKYEKYMTHSDLSQLENNAYKK